MAYCYKARADTSALLCQGLTAFSRQLPISLSLRRCRWLGRIRSTPARHTCTDGNDDAYTRISRLVSFCRSGVQTVNLRLRRPMRLQWRQPLHLNFSFCRVFG